MCDKGGEKKMPVVKSRRPMSVVFENDEEARKFDEWATSRKRSNSPEAKRVRAGLKSYRAMKKGINKSRG